MQSLSQRPKPNRVARQSRLGKYYCGGRATDCAKKMDHYDAPETKDGTEPVHIHSGAWTVRDEMLMGASKVTRPFAGGSVAMLSTPISNNNDLQPLGVWN